VLQTANSASFRNLSPKQIVPRLADEGIYLASEATFYRVLRENRQMTHRQRSRPPTHKRPDEFIATGPGQVWSWDITYLRSPVRGQFYYLYLIEDVWSRMIVGYQVHEFESMELSAELIEATCSAHGIDHAGLVLHSDNGGPMKGSTMLATLQKLGVVPSFSRPRVSDDNAFSESLFRTLKYRPQFPAQPFDALEQARGWVTEFVRWYNTEHRHSGIQYVTPQQRHHGLDVQILTRRHQLYRDAQQRHPQRWTGATRDWTPAGHVRLNPRTAARNLSPGQPVQRGPATCPE
jgi:transposase InsO family protein